jgi:hypothetical protein
VEYKGIAEELPGLKACLGSLRAAYVQLSQRYGHKAQAERNKASWDALAQALLGEAGADPYDYVRFVFRLYAPVHERPVYENMLVSMKTFAAYVKQLDEHEAELALILKLHANQLETSIERGLTLREALVQGACNAVFSYSAAKAVGDAALAAEYEAEARFQARFNPFYRRRLSRWLDEET